MSPFRLARNGRRQEDVLVTGGLTFTLASVLGSRCQPRALLRLVKSLSQTSARPRDLSPISAVGPIKEGTNAEIPPDDQRPSTRGRYRAGHAASLGVARPAGTDRDQVRMRSRRLRRVHGARGRTGHPVLSGDRREGPETPLHDDRGTLCRWRPSVSARLARGGRRAVRLLPAGDDSPGGGAARAEAPAERRRHRRGVRRPRLPVRHVAARSAGRSYGGPTGRCAMSASRRDFLRWSALAGAGLVIRVPLLAQKKAGGAPVRFVPNQ